MLFKGDSSMAKDPKEKLFKKSKIEIIKIFENSETLSMRGSFLIYNKKGSGAVRLLSGRDDDDRQYEVLVYKKRPLLITAAAGKTFEENQERLVSAGDGFRSILGKKLPMADETGANLSDAVFYFQDYINMLPAAGYHIYENELYPARGDGSFFYSLSAELQTEEGSLELNEEYAAVKNIMKYMLPTLEPEALDVELTKKYRNILLRGGDIGYALALHIGSGLNVLLYGHEKAAAAAAAGSGVKCAVISPINRRITGKRPHQRYVYSDISVPVHGLPEAAVSNGLTPPDSGILSSCETLAVLKGAGRNFGIRHFGENVSVKYPSFSQLVSQEKNIQSQSKAGM